MKKVVMGAALVWVGAAIVFAQGGSTAKPASPSAPTAAAAKALVRVESLGTQTRGSRPSRETLLVSFITF